ncbi:hypothetical protein [Pseudanabaena sp. 'Roaring Creek']|uniref:hypothetical protein n=1 Tax=Pseudanabaena sp. 'Roaring Creek' TaxID=1681830 RepID=UPI0006D81BF7|nr:hypothetical protein [Pseudanabaena sp. 'Roaring Creek']
MQVQTIEKIAPSIFVSSWNCQESALRLDFKFLVDYFKLTGDFCLLHWQARPRGLRRWGLYCGNQDKYFGVDYDRLIFAENLNIEALQVDEKIYKTVPSAVMCFRDAIAELSDEKIHIKRRQGNDRQDIQFD